MEEGEYRNLDLETKKQSIKKKRKKKTPSIWQLAFLRSRMEMWVFVFVPNIYFFVQQLESQDLDSGTSSVLKLLTKGRPSHVCLCFRSIASLYPPHLLFLEVWPISPSLCRAEGNSTTENMLNFLKIYFCEFYSISR